MNKTTNLFKTIRDAYCKFAQLELLQNSQRSVMKNEELTELKIKIREMVNSHC